MTDLIRPPSVDFSFKNPNHLLGKFYVDAYDRDGKWLGRGASEENDLLLNNMGTFLSGILRTPLSTGDPNDIATIKLIDRTGTTQAILLWLSTGSAGPFNIIVAGLTAGTMVGIGTSSVAPARADVDLTALLSLSPTTSFNYSSTSNQVIVAGSIVVSNAATVNEAGVYLKAVQGGFGVGATQSLPYLFAHDLVTPGVAVPSMGVASVNWALQI